MKNLASIPLSKKVITVSHPSQFWSSEAAKIPSRDESIQVERIADSAKLTVGGREVSLTNLDKLFWTEEKISKGDLLQFYADLAPVLLPHLVNRAMVMKRYPEGAGKPFFFQKHAPKSRPDWVPICQIRHASENVVDFPVVNDLAVLLWVVNLGCIDLNPWYATCDDVDRPDVLHFDLDPTPGATFQHVREAALRVKEALAALKIESYPKTTGSRGIHVYVPIVRGPLQKQVWTFAKSFAKDLAAAHPAILTAEYKVAKRPDQRVLVDYNQNAWGRTLASVYSVRPQPRATVSAPVTWKEVEEGIEITDFRLDNMRERIQRVGDLYQPLLASENRVKLEKFL